MPDGTVIDPKLNPRERDFGIVYVPDFGGNFKYHKSKGKPLTRGFLHGSKVYFDGYPEIFPNTLIIDGIPVIGYFKDTIDVKYVPDNSEPLLNEFYDVLTGGNTETAPNGITARIQNLINTNKLESDVK